MIAEEKVNTSVGDELWALMYDVGNAGRPKGELEFFANELKTCQGPALEIACGTGVVLFEMLRHGIDIYGLDLSTNMLKALYSKAEAIGIADIQERVTMQNMVNFRYDHQFDAIIVPARSFLYLTSQQDQIDCLRNIHSHLRDGGKLLLNFFNPMAYLEVISGTESAGGFLPMGTFEHPDTGENVDIKFSYTNDIPNQLQNGLMRFVFGGHSYDYEMPMRWIFKEEFQLLLRLSGFSRWEVYGSFSKKPFKGSDGEMIWKAWK